MLMFLLAPLCTGHACTGQRYLLLESGTGYRSPQYPVWVIHVIPAIPACQLTPRADIRPMPVFMITRPKQGSEGSENPSPFQMDPSVLRRQQ